MTGNGRAGGRGRDGMEGRHMGRVGGKQGKTNYVKQYTT